MPRPRTVTEEYQSDVNAKNAHEMEEVAALLSHLHLYVLLSAKLNDPDNHDLRYRVCAAGLFSAGVTLRSILSLTSRLSLESHNAVVLGRTFYETCLNCSFVSCTDHEQALQAEDYAIARAFKQQKRH